MRLHGAGVIGGLARGVAPEARMSRSLPAQLMLIEHCGCTFGGPRCLIETTLLVRRWDRFAAEPSPLPEPTMRTFPRARCRRAVAGASPCSSVCALSAPCAVFLAHRSSYPGVSCAASEEPVVTCNLSYRLGPSDHESSHTCTRTCWARSNSIGSSRDDAAVNPAG